MLPRRSVRQLNAWCGLVQDFMHTFLDSIKELTTAYELLESETINLTLDRLLHKLGNRIKRLLSIIMKVKIMPALEISIHHHLGRAREQRRRAIQHSITVPATRCQIMPPLHNLHVPPTWSASNYILCFTPPFTSARLGEEQDGQSRGMASRTCTGTFSSPKSKGHVPAVSDSPIAYGLWFSYSHSATRRSKKGLLNPP